MYFFELLNPECNYFKRASSLFSFDSTLAGELLNVLGLFTVERKNPCYVLQKTHYNKESIAQTVQNL